MSGENVTRLLVLAGILAVLALSACGGGSSATTITDHITRIHWSRCPHAHGASVSGMSCRAAKAEQHRFLDKGDTTSSAARIRTSDPQYFGEDGFACTQFPLEDGFGWHIVCSRGNQQLSYYRTPLPGPTAPPSS